MAYLTTDEQQTVTWFRELERDGQQHCEDIKLDVLGCITLVLKQEATPEAQAWLGYVKAQAQGKGASINFDGHGVLVLVLPRYVRLQQETFASLEASCPGGQEGRRGGQGQSESSQLGPSQSGGEGQPCSEA